MPMTSSHTSFRSSSVVPKGLRLHLSLNTVRALKRMRIQLGFYALWIVPLTLAIYFPSSTGLKCFSFVFVWRYLRLLVGAISSLRHRKAQVPTAVELTPMDVTVILPTVNPLSIEFHETITSGIRSGCNELIVVTVGEETRRRAEIFLAEFGSKIKVYCTIYANKRVQIVEGLKHVRTRFVVLADDHVFWPSPNFISSLIAPFGDATVGSVAPHKRVRRIGGSSLSFPSSASFLNLLGCLYLERHNFDLSATNGMDGGVFVVSGRTAAYRSQILCDPDLMSAFTNETWFFGRVGPLNADDDNFLTRWVVNRGWKIHFQTTPEALMETTLGVEGGYRKFHSQLLRWVRTTWRTNSTSIFCDRTVWSSQPWAVYSIYLTGFFNFALLMDSLLIYLAKVAAVELQISTSKAWLTMALWIFSSKLVKALPHFRRHPPDILYFPLCIVFGYYHSLLKLYTLFTVGNLSWGSRTGLVK